MVIMQYASKIAPRNAKREENTQKTELNRTENKYVCLFATEADKRIKK